MRDFDLYAGATQEYSERHREPEQPTLRDQFAMAALTGLIAKRDWVRSVTPYEAYTIADAMLLARAAK